MPLKERMEYNGRLRIVDINQKPLGKIFQQTGSLADGPGFWFSRAQMATVGYSSIREVVMNQDFFTRLLSLLTTSFVLFFGPASLATVDGNDRVFLVVKDIQSEDFFVERAPILGCYGLPQGARLGAWVAPYQAISNIGCGGPVAYDNINALSCATLIDAEEDKDYTSFREITLDISKCEHKDNPKFITMVRTTAKRNFPQAKPNQEVRLILKK